MNSDVFKGEDSLMSSPAKDETRKRESDSY